MKIKIIVFLLLTALFCNRGASQIDSTKEAVKYDAKVDTLRIQQVEKTPVAQEWYESSAMPWIVSLIIAFISVGVNLIISFSTRKTTIRTVKEQIDNSTNLASLQYSSTLNSINRQEWINKVRDCISELITQCKLLNVEFQEDIQNKERKNNLHEKVTYNRNKLRLLLSPQIQQHTDFLNSMKELIDILDIHLLNSNHNIEQYDNLDFMRKSDKVIDTGRDLLYFEWQKIQNVKFN